VKSKKVIKKRVSKKVVRSKVGKKKIKRVMEEFKSDKLHSGSKKGPLVKSRRQAVAIAISEAKKTTK